MQESKLAIIDQSFVFLHRIFSLFLVVNSFIPKWETAIFHLLLSAPRLVVEGKQATLEKSLSYTGGTVKHLHVNRKFERLYLLTRNKRFGLGLYKKKKTFNWGKTNLFCRSLFFYKLIRKHT